MQLSSKIYHVNAGLTNQYLFSFSIIREFDQFLVLLELFKLRIQDEPTLGIVIKHCTENPNRKSILTKVDNQLQDSLKLDYYQIENYLPELKSQVDKVNETYEDSTKLLNFPINNQFKVIFNRTQINRLYNDLNAFYSNYILLESLFNLTVNQFEEPKKEPVNINEKKDSLKKEYNENIKEEFLESKEESRLDEILNLCISSPLKSFLIHIIINYYFYISKNNIDIQDGQINIPSIFPMSYIFNLRYYESLVMSLNTYTIENVKMRTEKILKRLQDKDNIPIENMALTLLLFMYYLRFLQESHTDYLNNNIRKIFNDCDLQSRLLTNHTKNYFPKFNMTFKVNEISLNDIEDQNLDAQIEEFSKEYKHLIPISEEDFVEKIIKDLDGKNDDLIFNNKRIININHLKRLESAGVKKNNIMNPEFQNTDQHLLESDIFKYDFNNEFLTPALKVFNEYIEDSNSFFIKIKQNEITNIPKTILNLFETIKNVLYNQNIQNYYNTYDYYTLLKNNLNNPSIFPHTVFLYIIYQIIIPFNYANYDMIEFEDVF